MGLGREPQRAPKRGVPCAVTWRLQKADNALVGCLSFGVDVWHHGPATRLHAHVQFRGHLFPQKRSQHRARLVFLGGDEGHGVRVVRPVGRVGVHEHIRIHGAKQGHKGLGVSAVHFDEITVQVKVGGISTEPVALRPILVGPRAAIAPGRPTDIVLRNEDPARSGQRVAVILGQVQPRLNQRQTRIHPTRLTGMNGVVHQHPHLLSALMDQPLLHSFHPARHRRLCCAMFRDHERVNRPAHVACAHFMERHPRIGSRQRLAHLHSLMPCRRNVALGQAVHAPQRLT